MKLIQVNKDNEKYYSQDFIDGFNLGAKTQYEKDKETISADWSVMKNETY